MLPHISLNMDRQIRVLHEIALFGRKGSGGTVMKADIHELAAVITDPQRVSVRLRRWADSIPQSKMLFPSQYKDAQQQIHEASSSIADFIVAYLTPAQEEDPEGVI